MEKFIFENQNTNTYLVYKVSSEDVIDSLSLGMIKNNKIQGLASVTYTQMDAEKYIKYNISAKISLKEFFSRGVNQKRLLGVFGGIVNALLSAEDYMLDWDSIILDLEYIFVDVSSCETILICLPIQEVSNRQDIGAFFKGIMFNTQFDQTENCDYVARVINYLNSTPIFSLNDFKQLLDGIGQKRNVDNIGTAVPVQQSESNMVQSKIATPQQLLLNPIAGEQVINPTTGSGVNVQYKNPTPISVNNVPVMHNQPVNAGKEKEMSMFGLLMHYSKENAEIYKAQKAAKKNARAANISNVPSASKKSIKVSTHQKPPKKQKQQQVGFDVPGASLEGMQFDIPGKPAPQSVAQPIPPQMAQLSEVEKGVVPQTPPDTPHKINKGGRADFGETMVIAGGAIGETVVLNPSNNPLKGIVPYLVRKKNNEKIPINKPIFRIGKEKSFVDYYIGDNKTISRSHANFISRDGEFFIVDTNSTNHTYVNDEVIKSNIETPVCHGDKIMLADEVFEFKLR